MARVRRRKSETATPAPELPPDAGNVPGVLTVEAVKRGAMPPLGSSGLPASLEGDVPEHFRYWKASDDARAREVRDALVEAGLFEPSSIMKVDGELRRVVTKYFLADDRDIGRELVTMPPAERIAANALADSELPPLVLGLEDLEGDVAARLSKARELAGDHPFLVAVPDELETRAKLLEGGSVVFKLATRPGLVFATTLELDPMPHLSTLIERIVPESTPSREETLAKSAIDRARLVKADEERYVFGIVLEPDVVDSQNDTYSAEEVRKAAHRFMAEYQQIGHQHSAIVTGKIKILESYVAPADFEVGGQTVKKGTWLLATRVDDDELWEAVKSGDLTGYSIGGVAMRAPAEDPPS